MVLKNHGKKHLEVIPLEKKYFDECLSIAQEIFARAPIDIKVKKTK